MPLDKTPVNINFAAGLDTKTDKNQVSIGKFLALQNSVFDKAGALTKRNGFANISSLPNATETTITTLNNNLIATGSNLYAYNPAQKTWLNQGNVQPVSLNTLPLVRVSTSQSSPDSAIAANGLCLLVYVDNSVTYYQVSDSATGQQVVARTNILTIDTSATAVASARAHVLGNYFIITYLATVSGATHLRYIAIPVSAPSTAVSAADLSTSAASLTSGYNCSVSSSQGIMYFAYTAPSTTIKLNFIDSSLTTASATATPVTSSHSSTMISTSIDTSIPSAPIVWVSFVDGSNAYTSAYTAANQSNVFIQKLAATQIVTGGSLTIANITSVASNQTLTFFYEINNHYNSTGADPNTSRTDYVSKVTCTQSGTVGSPSVMLRSVGLASKAFNHPNGNIYMLLAYGESQQPTYFLSDSNGNLIMRLAYSNGGGYNTVNQVLPRFSSYNGLYYVPYLIKDFLATTNKTTNATGIAPNVTTAIYTQTGINLASIGINTSGQYSSEIAGALHLTGGQLWEYDGVKPVEHGFHVWPENISVTTATTGGTIGAGTYYYQFTYEWTDNQGNLHRSAPSIPISQVTTGSTSTNTLYVPTLRLTYKTAPNPVRIVGYRWSVAQQVYYQFTSITSPTLNDPTVDYVTITDTNSDVQILGQTLLYTTGSVVEDIAAPASIHSALFKSRLFLIDAEDQNLVWYSKQVIEGTPVEMSDLFTLYIAPTSGAQGSTGPLTALSAMDDKLILFKRDAIYYLTGTGPDNTGANNDFTDPTYVTSSVGCTNPASIVLTPNGIMFQSDKGIWLLGRDLSTTYIGAPVEQYNGITIESATSIPATNQIRFILASGITLMYDYYFGQWGTFSNINAISATLYQSQHTYLNQYGQVYQETPGLYLDGSTPVLMSFTTSWISLAGLQGYERWYYGHLLGTYYTPFKLNMQLAYDYNPSARQSVVIAPDNYAGVWGSDNLWGNGATWGGQSNVFEARFFPQTQKCETFQVTVNEVYDPTLGAAAGQGLSLSGMMLTVGAKKGSRTSKASRSFG